MLLEIGLVCVKTSYFSQGWSPDETRNPKFMLGCIDGVIVLRNFRLLSDGIGNMRLLRFRYPGYLGCQRLSRGVLLYVGYRIERKNVIG